MGMDGIVPTFDMNRNDGCCNNGWGNNGGWGLGGAAGGAFAGALIGSWFGNGWNGNGFGNRGGNGDCGCLSAQLAANSAALDNVQDSINGLGLQVLQGQNTANLSMCQGFANSIAATNNAAFGLQNTAAQGFAGLNNAITTGDAAIQQTLCQGFSGLNTNILVASKDNALQTCQSTNAITSAIGDCCCSTQRLIQQEACATRELIKDVQYQNTRDQLCQARDEISTLKSQNFTAGAVAGLGNQVRGEVNQAVNTILTHVRAFIPTTTPTATTPATA